MRPRQIAGFIAAIMIAFCGDSSAIAQGTDHQRQASDVFLFCGAYIPDVDRITACLRGNGPRLSRPCYATMCFSRPKTRIRGAGFKGSPFRLITAMIDKT
jgi:hypothetical protein